MSAKDQKKGALVPRLRFPEFRDTGEWEEIKLNNICDVLPGYGFPETLQGKQSGQYPFCKVSDISKAISDNGGLLKSSVNYIDDTELFLLKAKLIPAGSTVFAKIGEALRLNRRAISAVECLIDNNAVGIKAKDKKSTDYFLYILSQRINLNEYCGGAVPSVNKTTLENIDVLIPRIPEQQRIADCLFSLDERITAESSKLDTLKDHKKGLLKQLFPAEGETTPALRFPEFRDAGEWGQVPLGELILSQPDYGVNAPAVPYTSSLPTYIRITDISEEGQFIAEKKASVDVVATTENCLHPGDIVLARTGASVGKAYKYNENDGKLIFAGFLIRLKPNWRKINSNFLFNFLFTKRYWDWVTFTSPRSGQPGINSAEYATLPVPTPPNDGDAQREQQKIADCLSSLDELITAQTQKIDLLKDHKKGLMQQLFPCIEDVRA